MLDRSGPLLVVMDVDSTVIEQEVIELIADFAGVRADVQRITEAAMRGELDFEQSLTQRVALLEGLPASVLEEVSGQVLLTSGAIDLCNTLQGRGDVVALVSGGFDTVVARVAASLSIREFRANSLEIVDGRLTGAVLGDVVDRRAKADALRAYAMAHDIPMNRTVAVGDGANDLDMMAAAALGIAFDAKPLVRQQADAAITVRDLRLVLDVIDRF